MADRAGLVEQQPVNFEIPKALDTENYTYVNYLHALGSKDPKTFKRTGIQLPVGVNARFESIQPTLRPLNRRVTRYHAPGGRQSSWDFQGNQKQSGYVPLGYINEEIRVNPKPDNYYSSIF